MAGQPESDSRFQALLDRGMSREKAERVLNAEAESDAATSEPETYGDWTDEELDLHAAELGIEDRDDLSRDELIAAIGRR